MKWLLILLAIGMRAGIVAGQDHLRQDAEAVEPFVRRVMQAGASLHGVMEWPPSQHDPWHRVMYLAYERTTTLGDDQLRDHQWESVLYVLSSEDGIHYTERHTRGLGSQNSCWMPVALDTVLLLNVDQDGAMEFGVVLCHLPICDLYVPRASVVFVDDVRGMAQGKGADLSHLDFALSGGCSEGGAATLNAVRKGLRGRGLGLE